MIFKVDIRDYKLMENIFYKLNKFNLKIDSVIHFAGLKDTNKSINNALDYWDNNVNGSINLFKLMENLIVEILYLVVVQQSMIYQMVGTI